jgi:hemoglobin
MTDAPQDGVSPYDQLGGAAGVDAMVGDFYRRIFADPMLRPFFESTDRDKLFRMQHEFFGAALGGPVTYSGTSLSEAHAGRGIEPRHLARFTEHLVATLRDRGLSAEDADGVVARIAMHADDIVGGGGEDG